MCGAGGCTHAHRGLHSRPRLHTLTPTHSCTHTHVRTHTSRHVLTDYWQLHGGKQAGCTQLTPAPAHSVTFPSYYLLVVLAMFQSTHIKPIPNATPLRECTQIYTLHSSRAFATSSTWSLIWYLAVHLCKHQPKIRERILLYQVSARAIGYLEARVQCSRDEAVVCSCSRKKRWRREVSGGHFLKKICRCTSQSHKMTWIDKCCYFILSYQIKILDTLLLKKDGRINHDDNDVRRKVQVKV